MALTREQLVAAYNELYGQNPGPEQKIWDQLQDHQQIWTVLLNILIAVDPTFAPGGAGVNTPTLSTVAGPTTSTVPEGSLEVSIAVITGTATILGNNIGANETYVWRAGQGSVVGEIAFTVDPASIIRVLTVEPT